MFQPIFDNKNGYPIWHPFALKMINEFGSDESFLNELSANIGSFSSVGSSIDYFKTQIALMKQLVNNENLIIKKWARNSIKGLEKTILREKIDEESTR